jgi:hypothetical protein
MSLDFGWLKNVAEIASKVKVLTGADARCGDFVYNLSNGAYSINQLAGLMRTLGDQSLTGTIDSVSPYLNSTTLSDIACAIETKTGMNPLLVGGLAVTGATAGYKGLQYAYQYFGVKSPIALVQAVVEKFGPKLLNVDFTKLATVINTIMNSKADQMLNELKTNFPAAYNTMSEQAKTDYKAAVVKNAISELPKVLEAKRGDVTAAIAQSQVPVAVPSSVKANSTVDAQEAGLKIGSFDLADALSKILYNMPIAQSASPIAKLR